MEMILLPFKRSLNLTTNSDRIDVVRYYLRIVNHQEPAEYLRFSSFRNFTASIETRLNMASAEIPAESEQASSTHRLRSNSYDRAMAEGETEMKQLEPTTSADPPQPTSANKQPDNDIYLVKWIEFNRERLPILLQNINGPCPLLALANILLLRKRVKFFERK